MFTSSEEMRPMFELMKADQDSAGGPGYWRTYIAASFARASRPVEYTVEDFAHITVPTLILAGDRDEFCTPEEGVAAYRKLRQGELAILPGVGHFIPPTKVQLYVDFLHRHATARASA
jgi:pimeloyl-ACP methyl ester carboxylesterase